LECYLNPLAARCDELEQAAALNVADQLLLDQLSSLLGALYRYDQATDTLLAAYRQALDHAERPAPQLVPTLEQAILSQLAPAQLLIHREADPVYRLGCIRGFRQGCADTERQYQTLTSLCAQHAFLVPPLNYQPGPVEARMKRWLSPVLMTGPRLPAPTRRLLLAQTLATPPTSPHGA
jgi:hypothetical protein